MSNPTPENPVEPKRNVGGFQSHKPGCRCYPCKARRRKEETESGGSGEEDSKTLNAEIPDESALTTTVVRGSKGAPRAHIAQWIAHRATDPNLTTANIAEKMGMSRTYLNHLISRAASEGWLKFDNPLDRIEYELAPQAVKNLKKFLKEEDKTVTVEFAKGVLFPMYKEAHGVSENKQSILAIKIEFPKSETGEVIEGTKIVRGGNIVGRPNIFDGDAVEVIQGLMKPTESN